MEKRYIELVEHDITYRNKIVNVSDYINTRRNHEAYTSLFIFKEDVIEYIKNNLNPKTGRPSIENYVGEVTATFLWIDIDVEGNLPAATKYMLEVVDRLETEYGLTYKSLSVFFSGNKGYHIGIPTKSFGADELYSEILPQVFKLMVKIITKNFKGIDYKIYNTTRLFRCPLSQNKKSGRYKIAVSVPLLREEGHDNMLMQADFCNRHCTYKLTIEFSDKLKQVFDACVTQCANNVDVYADEEGFDKSLAVKENSSLFRLPQKGERNDLIYKQAYRLFAVKGLKANEVSDIMKFIYDATNEFSAKEKWDRYSEMEFKLSINSAYSRTRLRVVKDVKAKSFHAMAKTMYEKIKNSKFAKTIIPAITDDLNGGWMLGNSYAFIGKSGTMKSYLLQEEMIVKAIEEKKDSLFMNLEMSDSTFYDRVWMAMFHTSMSDMIKSGALNDNNIMEMQDKVAEIIGNYLHVYNGVDVEPEDVEGIIKSKEDEIKRKIVLVGIDSVSGMKLYNDSEAMTALKLSKGIKEAAKNSHTAIITINHANSSCPKTERDCSQYVRGGQKFCDNADAFLSMSVVVSAAESNFEKNPPDLIYARGIAYMRFVNKRGSGNTINKILKFEDNGRVSVSGDSPSSYEVDIPKTGWY